MQDLELEWRCLKFAKDIAIFCRGMKLDNINTTYIRSVISSSAFIGANYIEANEKLSTQDMMMHLRISRRKAKETQYWLELLQTENEKNSLKLKQEAEELGKIFSEIIKKQE